MKTNRSSSTLAISALTFLALSSLSLHAALVQNPSFEINWNETWPHYSGADNWNGASGVNDRSLDPGGPFHDNGKTPDGNRVLFRQQAGDVSQDIVGLVPGQAYWIQFYYNTRGDVQSGSCDITTRFNGVDLDAVTGIQRVTAPEGTNAITVPFYARSVPLVADSDSGTLLFHVATVGDRTALLDAVTIVPRDTDGIVVMNPSFEASGMLPAVGPITNGLAGWTGTGVFGVDTAGGTYANNGAVPEQDLVAFIEGPGSLSQTVRGLVAGTPYKLQLAYNARSGETPHLQVTADGVSVFETDVAAVGGSSPFSTKEITFTPTTNIIVLSFAQIKSGTDAVLLDDIRLRGQADVDLPPMQVTPPKAELAPGQSVVISVTVPPEKLAISAADITVASSETNTVRLNGAGPDGTLVLHYAKGGPTTQTVEAVAVRRGTASVNIPESAGLVVPNGVLIHVVESFVRNPSFEAEQAPSGIGAGAVLAWTGQGTVGVNVITQPFAADSGTIPDRVQVAFIQGAGSLSQEITGLTPGAAYWLQLRYALRNNPDPNGPAADLAVNIGGTPIATIGPVVPLAQSSATAYYLTNLVFTPTNATQTLQFTCSNVKGDATMLLDAINIVRRGADELMVQNPSFEASGAMDLYVEGPNTALISGWDISGGGRGTASGGPFADNGTIPDQDQALFLQGAGSAWQVVSGFALDQKYTLVYSVNARGCCGDPPIVTHYLVLAGTPGAAVSVLEEDISPVTGMRAYNRRAVVFTASFTDQEIRFEHAPSGDRSFVLDDVRVVVGEVGEPPTPSISTQGDGTVTLAWPAPATGYLLQSAPYASGPWTNDQAIVTLESGRKVANVQASQGARFFRLSL